MARIWIGSKRPESKSQIPVPSPSPALTYVCGSARTAWKNFSIVGLATASRLWRRNGASAAAFSAVVLAWSMRVCSDRLIARLGMIAWARCERGNGQWAMGSGHRGWQRATGKGQRATGKRQKATGDELSGVS